MMSVVFSFFPVSRQKLFKFFLFFFQVAYTWQMLRVAGKYSQSIFQLRWCSSMKRKTFFWYWILIWPLFCVMWNCLVRLKKFKRSVIYNSNMQLVTGPMPMKTWNKLGRKWILVQNMKLNLNSWSSLISFSFCWMMSLHSEGVLKHYRWPVLKVWMDGHGRRPGTYFQYVLASSHFLGHFGEILESVHALLFSHFKHCRWLN